MRKCMEKDFESLSVSNFALMLCTDLGQTDTASFEIKAVLNPNATEDISNFVWRPIVIE